MDRPVTYLNALTALTPSGAKIPIYFDTDREAVAFALQSLALDAAVQARIIRIGDTLSLSALEISEAYLPALAGRTDLEVMESAKEMAFTAEGNLDCGRLFCLP
jgi:hypothetical protein